MRVLAQASLGVLSGLRGQHKKRTGVRALLYHGGIAARTDARLHRYFHTFSELREHVLVLRRLRTLSIDDLDRSLSTGTPAKSGVIVTFDDGYANNLEAIDIFLSAGIPVTVFLTAGLIGSAQSIWPAELSLYLLKGEATSVSVFDRNLSLATRPLREEAYESIRRALKDSNAVSRNRILADIRGQFPPSEIDRLLSLHPEFRMLTWDDVRTLRSRGATIGSHGVSHELHNSVESESVRHRELGESRVVIAREAGESPKYFAFPDGRFCDQSASELQSEGYRLGFTTIDGTITRNSSNYLLPRIAPATSIPAFARNYFWQRRV